MTARDIETLRATPIPTQADTRKPLRPGAKGARIVLPGQEHEPVAFPPFPHRSRLHTGLEGQVMHNPLTPRL